MATCSTKPEKPHRDRLVFHVLRLIRGQTHSSAARAAGLSPSTISRLRKGVKAGGTRYPQAITITLILNANGYDLRPVKQTNRSQK